ncbi:MAG TPA: hypothetical protein VFV66_20825 [Nonomuraea sp.]|nr:hypothetical protein [Nonomuraea sp.]
MGHRAHYVIVQDGSWDVHFSDSGASDLDLDLLPGPDFALTFMSGQRHLTGRELVWTNELLCEAAAIVVPGAKRLGFYLVNHGGIMSRSVLLDVLALTWPGWRVEWLYQGLADVLVRLGEDLRQVHVGVSSFLRRLRPAGHYRGCLVTVAEMGGIRAYALLNAPVEVVAMGERVLSRLPTEALTTALHQTPDSGVHFDLVARQAWLWSIDPLYRVLDWPSTGWPGWTWHFLADDWAAHLAMTANTVRFPVMERCKALSKLETRIGRHAARRPAGQAFTPADLALAQPGPAGHDRGMATPEESDHAAARQGAYAPVLTAIAALARRM